MRAVVSDSTDRLSAGRFLLALTPIAEDLDHLRTCVRADAVVHAGVDVWALRVSMQIDHGRLQARICAPDEPHSHCADEGRSATALPTSLRDIAAVSILSRVFDGVVAGLLGGLVGLVARQRKVLDGMVASGLRTLDGLVSRDLRVIVDRLPRWIIEPLSPVKGDGSVIILDEKARSGNGKVLVADVLRLYTIGIPD